MTTKEITVVDNQLEQISGLSKILDLTITDKFDVVLVNDSSDEKRARENIKQIQTAKKDYQELIEPYKSTLNKLHKMVTAKEKENLAVFDEAVSKQKEPIDEYNRIIYEKQQKAIREAQERARAEEERIRKAEQERIEAEKAALAKQVEDDQSIDSIIAAKAKLEDINAEENALNNIQVIPDKVISKKNEVVKKYEYVITDVARFIEWALRNNHRRLLRIEPNVFEFKQWCKTNPDTELGFIEKIERYV